MSLVFVENTAATCNQSKVLISNKTMFSVFFLAFLFLTDYFTITDILNTTSLFFK